jgi:N-acetylneuraminic acid mutarotase
VLIKQWLPRVQVLHAGQGNWDRLADYPVPVDYALVAWLPPRLYVVGGQNADGKLTETRSLSLENPTAGWQPGPRLPRPLSRLRGGTWGNTIVAITDEPVGVDDARARGPVVITLDTTAPDASWKEISTVPQPQVGYRAAAVAGDKLFLFGGASPVGADQLQLTDKVWSYSLPTGEWSACARLPSPIRDATAVRLDDRHIALAGGVEEAVNSASAPNRTARILLSTRCLIYDLLEDSFRETEPLRLATADHGLAVLGKRLYVVGGEDSPYRTRTDLVQRCDLQTLLEGAIANRGPHANAFDNGDSTVNQHQQR